MSTKPRFFCESCGAEVAKNAKFCKHCGKFFSAVLCPKCGYSGTSTQFGKGCPQCGYAVGARSRGDEYSGKKSQRLHGRSKNGRHLDPLPGWIYAVVACLAAGVLLLILL